MNATDRKLLLEGRKMVGGVFRPRFTVHGEVKLAPSLYIQFRAANPTTGGKRLLVRENAKTLSFRDAQLLLAARKDDLKRGKLTGPIGDKITYDDLANALIRDYEAKGRKSLRRVKIGLAHLKGHFGGWRANAITSEQVNEYIVARKDEDAAPASINRELAMLRRMFNLYDKLPSKPKIELLPEHNRREGFFEHAEVEALVRQMPNYLKPVIRAAFITGWRVKSELLTREKRHVDLKGGWLKLDDGEGKTGEARRFPLTPELRNVLEQQLAWSREIEKARGIVIARLFHHNDGSPIKDFRSAWNLACKRAGLIGRIPHDFRRSAVRNLERSHPPRSAAMKMVGHKTEAIYRRYAIADESMLQDAALRLSALHQADAAQPAKVPTAISGSATA